MLLKRQIDARILYDEIDVKLQPTWLKPIQRDDFRKRQRGNAERMEKSGILELLHGTPVLTEDDLFM